jgi:hypothetical protein
MKESDLSPTDTCNSKTDSFLSKRNILFCVYHSLYDIQLEKQHETSGCLDIIYTDCKLKGDKHLIHITRA